MKWKRDGLNVDAENSDFATTLMNNSKFQFETFEHKKLSVRQCYRFLRRPKLGEASIEFKINYKLLILPSGKFTRKIYPETFTSTVDSSFGSMLPQIHFAVCQPRNVGIALFGSFKEKVTNGIITKEAEIFRWKASEKFFSSAKWTATIFLRIFCLTGRNLPEIPRKSFFALLTKLWKQKAQF